MFNPRATSFVERVTFPMRIGMGAGAQVAETIDIREKNTKSLHSGA